MVATNQVLVEHPQVYYQHACTRAIPLGHLENQQGAYNSQGWGSYGPSSWWIVGDLRPTPPRL